SVYDLVWARNPDGSVVTYGDVYLQNEVEQSTYNFEYANVPALFDQFSLYEEECTRLVAANLPLAAYEQTLKASHTFNLLDARKAVSVTERQRYILRVRNMARAVAHSYLNSRAEAGFPMAAKHLAEEALEKIEKEKASQSQQKERSKA